MNWIRISTGIMRDPTLIALSVALGVSVPLTTGHVVGVLTSMPEGSKNGDLSSVPDHAIEQWALWRGKRGDFARAFRAHLCDAHGVVRAWEKYNGAALKRLDDDRQRKRAAYEAAKQRNISANSPQEKMRDSAAENAYETRRDETRRTTKLQQPTTGTERAKARRPPASFPHFDKAVCDAAYELWQSSAGAVDYGRFRKAFGPLFAADESTRPAGYPRDAELVPAIRLYLGATLGTREAQFRSPDKCAGALSGMVDVLRSTRDPLAQLDGAQAHLGITRPRGIAA